MEGRACEWGQPELQTILAIARYAVLAGAAAEAEEAVAEAETCVAEERARQLRRLEAAGLA